MQSIDKHKKLEGTYKGTETKGKERRTWWGFPSQNTSLYSMQSMKITVGVIIDE